MSTTMSTLSLSLVPPVTGPRINFAQFNRHQDGLIVPFVVSKVVIKLKLTINPKQKINCVSLVRVSGKRVNKKKKRKLETVESILIPITTISESVDDLILDITPAGDFVRRTMADETFMIGEKQLKLKRFRLEVSLTEPAETECITFFLTRVRSYAEIERRKEELCSWILVNFTIPTAGHTKFVFRHLGSTHIDDSKYTLKARLTDSAEWTTMAGVWNNNGCLVFPLCRDSFDALVRVNDFLCDSEEKPGLLLELFNCMESVFKQTVAL